MAETKNAANKELDATIKVFEGDLTSVEPKAAVSNIDHWVKTLHGVDSHEAKLITTELEALKKHLEEGKLDGKVIGHSLTKLGTETTKASKDAGEGLSEKLHSLGQLLTKAGKSLA